MLPGTVDGMVHVCYFRHALALDERRVKFLPEYAYGGRAVRGNTQSTNNGTKNHDASLSTHLKEKGIVGDSYVRKRSNPQHPQTLEVWFAGTHSDM